MGLKKIAHNYLRSLLWTALLLYPHSIVRSWAALTCWKKMWCIECIGGCLKTPLTRLMYFPFPDFSWPVIRARGKGVGGLRYRSGSHSPPPPSPLLHHVKSHSVLCSSKHYSLAWEGGGGMMIAYFGLKIISILWRLSSFFSSYLKVLCWWESGASQCSPACRLWGSRV